MCSAAISWRCRSNSAIFAELGRQEAEFKTGVPQVVGISTGEVRNLFAKSVNDLSYQYETKLGSDEARLAEGNAKAEREAQALEQEQNADSKALNTEEQEAAKRAAKMNAAVRELMADFSNVKKFLENSGIRAHARKIGEARRAKRRHIRERQAHSRHEPALRYSVGGRPEVRFPG